MFHKKPLNVMQLNAQEHNDTQEIRLKKQLKTYFYPAKIEQELQDNYILRSLDKQRCIADNRCHYYVLRQAKLAGYWPAHEDTELLTSLSYLHGMILHFPHRVTQAHLIALQAGASCNVFEPIRARLSSYHQCIIINLSQLLVSKAPAEQINSPLYARTSLILKPSEELELSNNSNNTANLLLLEINADGDQ